MRCVECGREKTPDERGWVTVLSPAGEPRIRYCCSCIEELVTRETTADDADDHADEE